MRFCNYCSNLIPSGYDIWWNQKAYHPDCAIQVAVTDTERKLQMNCKYCEKHILATTQVMWKGYPFHENCLVKAIQEANQPPKEEITSADNEFGENFFPEDEEDFADDELAAAFEAEEPEYANGAERVEMPANSIVAAPRAIIHPPEGNGNPDLQRAGTLITHCGSKRISRTDLESIKTPEATDTFKPIGHADLINKIMDSLWYRRMNVVRDEYAVSPDGMKMFGLIELDLEYKGVRFAIGIRNSNDKSMRLAMVAGYKVAICDNMMLQGDFQPMLAKHTKNFELQDALAIACDRVQRNFGALHGEITAKQEKRIEISFARELVYRAFTDGKFPISLMKTVHREFFIAPSYEEFKQSTMWSLENAFTTTFKKLQPVSQFEYTARLGNFLASYN